MCALLILDTPASHSEKNSVTGIKVGRYRHIQVRAFLPFCCAVSEGTIPSHLDNPVPILSCPVPSRGINGRGRDGTGQYVATHI